MIIDINMVVDLWGLALLHFLWQGTLIGAVAAISLKLTQAARPQARYAIAGLALLLCFSIPLCSVLLHLVGSAAPVSEQLVATSPPVSGIAFVSTQAPLATHVAGQSYLGWLVVAWSVGCLFFLARLALGLRWITLTKRMPKVIPSKAEDAVLRSLENAIAKLAQRLSVKRPVRLVLCIGIDGPMTAGWSRPVILLPAVMLTKLPVDLIEALLAHELAHVKRFDYVFNLLQRVAEATLFFHPAVWWLSMQIRRERENIADDLAAQALGQSRQLAVALVALNDYHSAQSWLAPSAHGGQLSARIRRLVRPSMPVLNWKAATASIFCILIAFTVFAREVSKEQTSARKSTSLKATAEISKDVSFTKPADLTNPPTLPSSLSEPTPPTLPKLPNPPNPPIAPSPIAAPAAPAVLEAPQPPQPPRAPILGKQTLTFVESRQTDRERSLEQFESNQQMASEEKVRKEKHEAEAVAITNDNNSRSKQSYALVTAGKPGFMISGNVDDINDVKRAQKKFSGDFVWLRRSDKVYLLQDPQIIQEVKNAWAESNKFSALMDVIGAQMEAHSKAVEAIGEKMRIANGDTRPTHASINDAAARLRQLASKQESLARENRNASEQLVLENSKIRRQQLTQAIDTRNEEIQTTNQKMEQLRSEIESQTGELEQKLQPLEALGKEIEIASKPLRSMGKRMEILGKQLEVLTKKADEKVSLIFDDALKNSLATPIEKRIKN